MDVHLLGARGRGIRRSRHSFNDSLWPANQKISPAAGAAKTIAASTVMTSIAGARTRFQKGASESGEVVRSCLLRRTPGLSRPAHGMDTPTHLCRHRVSVKESARREQTWDSR